MVMYSELEKEFAQPMEVAGFSFKNEYTKTLNSFEGYNFTSQDEKYKAIKAVLQQILNDYAETKPATKGGKVARFFAKLFSYILPAIKFK